MFDYFLSELIPLDLWMRLNCSQDDLVDVQIERKGKKHLLKLLPRPIRENDLPATIMPYFINKNTAENFNKLIPYISFRGLIITSLTHELLSIFCRRGLLIENNIVNKLLNGKNVGSYHLVIIDSIDPELADEFKITCIKSVLNHENEKIEIPVNLLVTIEDKMVSTLNDVQNIINGLEKNITCVLSIGFAYHEQNLFAC